MLRVKEACNNTSKYKINWCACSAFCASQEWGRLDLTMREGHQKPSIFAGMELSTIFSIAFSYFSETVLL